MGIFEHLTIQDYVEEESYSERVYLQFWIGHVDFAISHRKNPLYTEPKDINAILVKEHINSDMSQGKFNKKFYPLMRGLVDCPMPGDQVLLCQFGGENYYLGPLNTLNKPNFNIDHLFRNANSDGSVPGLSGIHDTTNIKHTHKLSNLARLEKTWIKNLDDPDDEYDGRNPNMSSEEYSKTHQIGDMYLEGRYGNSIRIGGRKNTPNILISNGRIKQGVKPAACNRETLADTSLFSIVSILFISKPNLSLNFTYFLSQHDQLVLYLIFLSNHLPNLIPTPTFDDTKKPSYISSFIKLYQYTPFNSKSLK